MDARTRAVESNAAGAARVALAMLACAVALVLAIVLAPPAHADAAAGSLQAQSDARLAQRSTELDAEANRIGSALLDADAARDSILQERDVAQGQLAEFLAAAYRQGGTDGDFLEGLLTAGSIQEAADRVRIADVISSHHRNLLESLDDAQARLDATMVERAASIRRLGQVQSDLVAIHAEQARRVAVRERAASDRAAQAEAAAAKRVRDAAAVASIVPGSLVGNVTASPSAMVVASGPPSAAGIDAYLASKGSPMTGQGSAFLASAGRWRVDPRLVVAISGAESSFGAMTCGPFNAWGWSCPNDPADFADWPTAIETITRGLREYYLDEGRTSVALIQQKYCPVGAANDPTGLNSHWAQNVTRFLAEQGGNPSMVGPGPSGLVGMPDLGGLGLAGD
jgi:hypothetical protein